MNSVNTVTLDYSLANNKPDIEEDLNLTHEYFTKLKNTNLKNIEFLPLEEIKEILKNWKINHIEFKGTSYNPKYEMSIESKNNSFPV